MKAIIIEDEINVRSGFIKMLHAFCPDVEVIGYAEDVESGIKLINDNTFNVLFLDINLPDGTGFDIIHRMTNKSFHIIFVTAYDQYALDAFKVSASDYLMKPVSPDALQSAIRKLHSESQTAQNSIAILEERIKGEYGQEEKIILKNSDTIKIVSFMDIIYCEAEGSYTIFILVSGDKIMTSTYLKEYERIMQPYGFIRTHHSYLVNINHVHTLHKSESYIALTGGSSVALSSRKKQQVLEALSKRFIG